MTDMIINERLKAISRYVQDILCSSSEAEQLEIAVFIGQHLTAIQTTISSAESEAGKLAHEIHDAVKYNFMDAKYGVTRLITAALLKAGGQVWMDISTAPKDGAWVRLKGGSVNDYGWDSKGEKPPEVVAQYATKGDFAGRWQFAWWDCGVYGCYENPTHYQLIMPSSQGGK